MLAFPTPPSPRQLLRRGAEEDGDAGPGGRHQPARPGVLPPPAGHMVQRWTEDNPQQPNVGTVPPPVSASQPCREDELPLTALLIIFILQR